MRNTIFCAAAAVLTVILSTPDRASAQVPPFFNGNPGLFDPEIDVVNTGVVNDVQATVSADRRYVTLNMRSSQSTLVALREFKFQGGAGGGNLPQGFAGDAQPAPAAAPAPARVPPRKGDANTDPADPADPRRPKLPSEARASGDAAASILHREGMTLIGSTRPATGAALPSGRAGSP